LHTALLGIIVDAGNTEANNRERQISEVSIVSCISILTLITEYLWSEAKVVYFNEVPLRWLGKY
jgi:hypothetical protein